MLMIIRLTLLGIFRDRVFQGILTAAVLFLFIPALASFSMRQVTELSITLSLSLISFILLLLSVFLGGTLVWKDIERRYTHNILSLPMERGAYLLGKYLGAALFMLLTACVLGIVSIVVVMYASTIYPPFRPVVWGNVACAIVFEGMKYVLLTACAFLFSTFSTSFFLPIFGTLAVFFVGCASQGAFDFVHSASGSTLHPLIVKAAGILYYVIPNFSAFNLKLQAVYGLPLAQNGILLTIGYFLIYVVIVMTLAVSVFSRREMK